MSTQMRPGFEHSICQEFRKVVAFFVPGAARHTGIAFKAKGRGAIGRRVAMDGKQQIRRLRVDGLGTLAGFGGGIVAVAGGQRNEVWVSLQPAQQCGGGRSGHFSFLHDSPCPRVAAAMSGVHRNPVRRVPHHGAKIVLVSPVAAPMGASQRCFPEEKCCAEAKQADQQRHNGAQRPLTPLFPSGSVFGTSFVCHRLT